MEEDEFEQQVNHMYGKYVRVQGQFNAENLINNSLWKEAVQNIRNNAIDTITIRVTKYEDDHLELLFDDNGKEHRLRSYDYMNLIVDGKLCFSMCEGQDLEFHFKLRNLDHITIGLKGNEIRKPPARLLWEELVTTYGFEVL